MQQLRVTRRGRTRQEPEPVAEISTAAVASAASASEDAAELLERIAEVLCA